MNNMKIQISIENSNNAITFANANEIIEVLRKELCELTPEAVLNNELTFYQEAGLIPVKSICPDVLSIFGEQHILFATHRLLNLIIKDYDFDVEKILGSVNDLIKVGFSPETLMHDWCIVERFMEDRQEVIEERNANIAAWDRDQDGDEDLSCLKVTRSLTYYDQYFR